MRRIAATIGKQADDAQADVVTLRAAEWAGLDATPVLPPARLFAGFYLNELVMKLLARGDAHPALFDAYAATLRSCEYGRLAPFAATVTRPLLRVNRSRIRLVSLQS